jgi:hypothetical protein
MSAESVGKGRPDIIQPVRRKRAPRTRGRKDTAPTRHKAFWGIFDDQLRRVAVYEHTERSEAAAAAKELSETQHGSYFVSVVSLSSGFRLGRECQCDRIS